MQISSSRFYGPATLRIFVSNLSRNAVARQVARKLHSVTWVVSQYLARVASAKGKGKRGGGERGKEKNGRGEATQYFVARSKLVTTDCSNWQHHCKVYHHSSKCSRNFTAVLTSAHAYTSRFSFQRARSPQARPINRVKNTASC